MLSVHARTGIPQDDRVLSVAFSPDGLTLASGSPDRSIKLWGAASGRELRTLSQQSSQPVWLSPVEFVWPVAFSPDGLTLASGGVDHSIKLWDVASGRELRTLRGHSEVVYSVAFSPDGRTLASGSDDHSIKLWDMASGRELRTLSGHFDEVRICRLLPGRPHAGLGQHGPQHQALGRGQRS